MFIDILEYAIAHNRLQYSINICTVLSVMQYIQYIINITFICIGQPKSSFDSLYFDIRFIAVWNPTVSPEYACICFSGTLPERGR